MLLVPLPLPPMLGVPSPKVEEEGVREGEREPLEETLGDEVAVTPPLPVTPPAVFEGPSCEGDTLVLPLGVK